MRREVVAMQSETPRPYRAIADYLGQQGGSSAVLTYADVEALTGKRLPLGAIVSSTWWTNASLLHVRLWREHGWRAVPDQRNRRVLFTREAEEG